MKRWTDSFKDAASARIQQDEAFLAACGIVPVTGIEQEFYVIKDGRHVPINEKAASLTFKNSPFVETIHDEKSGKDKYELILGVGNGANEKARPHASLKASTMIKAHESARALLETGATAFMPATAIDLDGTRAGGSSGLQCNISLWDKETGQSLFIGNAPVNRHVTAANDFTMECGKSLLEAQKALAALVITSPHALTRVKSEVQRHSPHLFGLGYAKQPYYSLSLRTTRNLAEDRPTKDVPLYFENRLPGGAEDSTLAMMITLAGITQGVKNYMHHNAIETTEEMKTHIASQWFHDVRPTPITVDSIAAIPASLPAMLEATQQSELAKEIMGQRFHREFCNAYKSEVAGEKGVTR